MEDMNMANDVLEEVGEPTCEMLELQLRDLLGDLVTFKFLAHGAHWNVRGINFSAFHEFFGEIYSDADSLIDPLAENIRKLNYDAPFKLQDFMDDATEMPVSPTNDAIDLARALYVANEDVRACIVKAIPTATAVAEQGIVNFLADMQDRHSKWQWQLRATIGDDFADANEIDVEEESELPYTEAEQPATDMTSEVVIPVVEMNATATKWAKASEMIVRKLEPLQEVPISEERGSKIETRVNHVDVEMRATSADGMTFEGYASVFNSPSEPIGGKFTEYVAPGAFKRSLSARNDVKLLWNHDTGQVLGSTRAGTLQLVEDAHGLKAIATLPDTQLGRDAATLLKRGDVANMSFGFSVPAGGDVWSGDGMTRTLNSVRLHEVSIVAFPAYQASTANVRAEVRSIDATLLTDGLTKLENGDDLTPAEAEALTGVVAKLTKTEKVEASLDLLKAKLSLQAKAI